MADFADALMRTLLFEGDEETQDPRDPGGDTRFGITAREALCFRYTGKMADIPFDLVEKIFRVSYWNTLKLDGVEASKQHLANHLFDAAVNCGTLQASKMIQNTLNSLFKTALLDTDGILGTRTLEAIRYFVTPENLMQVVSTFCQFRKARYDELIKLKTELACFKDGWYKRCDPNT